MCIYFGVIDSLNSIGNKVESWYIGYIIFVWHNFTYNNRIHNPIKDKWCPFTDIKW